MVGRKGVLSRRLFLIRATIPLVCLAVLWSTPGDHFILLGLLIVNSLDVLAGLMVLLLRRPTLWDYQFAAIRDALYALIFYFTFVQSLHSPALALVPSVLTEVFVLFGPKAFYRAVAVEIVLMFGRMLTMQHRMHQLRHPAWSIGIAVASIIMGLLGLEITRLEELQANILRQREQLKETLTEMLTTTLYSSGIGEGVLKRENISLMLEEICSAANRSKGREIGQHLGRVIALKHAASSLLTARELEVLSLVAQHKSYRQIALHLQVSEGTVRAHAAAIMRKVEVHSRDEMVEWACKHELLPCTESVVMKADSREQALSTQSQVP